MTDAPDDGPVVLVVESNGSASLEASLRVEHRFSVRRSTESSVLDALDGGVVDCIVCQHGDGVDGLSLLRRIRRVDPELPVILAPVDGDEALASTAIEHGATGYVPWGDRHEIDEYVRSAIERVAALRPDPGSKMPIANRGVREELRLKERAMDEAPVGITITESGLPDNPLIYVNDAFERLTGYPKAETVGRNCRFLQGENSDPSAVAEMRAGIDAGEHVSVELVNYRRDGTEFWNRVDISPVRDDDGEIANYVGFQTDITDRKNAEFEVLRERRNLEHLVNRINGLIEAVTSELVQAVDRDDIAEGVCRSVVEETTYPTAWLGVRDLQRDVIRSLSWAGTPAPPDPIEVPLAGDPLHPAAHAVATRAVTVVDDPPEVAATLASMDHDARDVAAIAAIPLVYKHTVYGAFTVHSDSVSAFNERELTVLEALGRAIATTMNALESRRIITTDTVVELELSIGDRSFFPARVSAVTGQALEYHGSVTHDDGTVGVFFESTADLAAMTDAIADLESALSVRVLSESDEVTLFEFTASTDSFVTFAAELGARIVDVTAVDGTGRVRLELPPDVGPRSLVATFKEAFDAVEVLSVRERERPPKTRKEFLAELEENLTQRQLAALRTAYVGGFYEDTRRVSGDDLAETLGVSRSTYHQHLRAAERKLVSEFFDR